MEKLYKLINKILSRFNIGLVKKFPRHSTRIAKKLFKNKPITAVEIGTDKGSNARSILETLNIGRIYLIDPWEEHGEYHRTQEDLSNAEKEARKRLNKYSSKTVFIKKYSDEAIKNVPDKIDFIYIDGDHSYKQTKKDMENYWPKIRKGGIFAGHDITGQHDKEKEGWQELS